MLTIAGCGLETSGRGPGEAAGASTDLLTWQSLPVLGHERFTLFTSYDRDPQSKYLFAPPGDKDFNNFLAVCGGRPAILYQTVEPDRQCDPGAAGYLIAAQDGPGFIARVQLAMLKIGPDFTIGSKLTTERLRIYVDGASTPAHDVLLSDLKQANTPPFVAPLTRWTSGATVSYTPIAFHSKLRVYIDELDLIGSYYYQVETQGLPASPRAISLDRDVLAANMSDPAAGDERWADFAQTLDPGQRVRLLDRVGPGTVQNVAITVREATAEALRDLRLEASWDGAAEPAISSTLASAFAAEHGVFAFNTVAMSVQITQRGAELGLRLPMPFAGAASLSLINDGAVAHDVASVIYGSSSLPTGEFGQLHVLARRQTEPFAPGDRYTVAALGGRGKYVGTVLNMRGRSDKSWVLADPLNMLEGDPTVAIDGASSYGTGTEEFFDAGLYAAEGTYDSPFAAIPHLKSDKVADSGTASMVRWNVLTDAMNFQRGLELSWELGPSNPAVASEYASAAFYYAP